MTTGMMKFPDNRIASFTCSFGAADQSVYEVVGTKGVLKMDPAYEMAEALKSEITVDGRVQKKTFPKSDQFAPEFVYFSECIINNKQPEPSGQEGLADVRVIRAVLESAETNRPVSLPQTQIARRPDSSQEISKKAVAQPPELVKAAAPGAK
jgi:glucose-fructose oxidoreductase